MSPTSENSSVTDPPAFLPGTRLEVKRIDKARIPSTGQWEFFDTEELAQENVVDKYAAYDEYVFIFQRTIVQNGGSELPTISFTILIQSDCLRQAVKAVIKNVQNVSWHSQRLEVNPQQLLAFLPQFREHLAQLHQNDLPTDQDKTAEHLCFLIDFLEAEYAAVLQEIKTFTSHGEITFDLLWSILVPPSVIFTLCKTTSEPRAVRLREITLATDFMTNQPYWILDCEYVDANDDSAGRIWGLADITLNISQFRGVKKINELNAYPMKWHLNKDKVQARILERGRRWLQLTGVHHMHYNGTAYRHRTKLKVDGRVMIDRKTFAGSEPNYERGFGDRELLSDCSFDEPEPVSPVKSMQANDIHDDDILLTTPILYGFSLDDKCWLEFNVEYVSSIEWNDEGFKNIAIDPDRKDIIQSLVASHANNDTFDDFVQGKGRGLVINLFGPPGVGKTLTVEATSEYLRRPLYIVSAGELGTDPSTLEKTLANVFALIPLWNAVVLIDEADVFLEERGVDNVERNAIVAVFLRQLEYFGGILFLTTNRVKSFDQAFQSRIHLSLHYTDLSRDSREQLWRAFLEKTANTHLGLQYPTSAEVRKLSELELNGRQIKNVVKLATTLACHLDEKLSFEHIARALGVMEDPQRRNNPIVPKADFRPMGYFAFGFLSACAILHILRSK